MNLPYLLISLCVAILCFSKPFHQKSRILKEDSQKKDTISLSDKYQRGYWRPLGQNDSRAHRLYRETAHPRSFELGGVAFDASWSRSLHRQLPEQYPLPPQTEFFYDTHLYSHFQLWATYHIQPFMTLGTQFEDYMDKSSTQEEHIFIWKLRVQYLLPD